MAKTTATTPSTPRSWGEILTDIYNIRIAAAIVLAVFLIYTVTLLFISQVQRGDTDPTVNEGLLRFLFEIGIPAAVFFAVTASVCGKRRTKFKYNALAPVSLLLLIFGCLGMAIWVYVFCFHLKYDLSVPIPGTDTAQVQHHDYPVVKGVTLICQYFAWYLAFLLGLDVFAVNSK